LHGIAASLFLPLFLNDSFSEDGAQEYAVVRDGRQIESLTVSWMARAEAWADIDWLVHGGGGIMGLSMSKWRPLKGIAVGCAVRFETLELSLTGLRELLGSGAGGYEFSFGTSFGGVPPPGLPEKSFLREWRCLCPWGSSARCRQLRKTAARETKTP
jgi:hypothetical protein